MTVHGVKSEWHNGALQQLSTHPEGNNTGLRGAFTARATDREQKCFQGQEVERSLAKNSRLLQKLYEFPGANALQETEFYPFWCLFTGSTGGRSQGAATYTWSAYLSGPLERRAEAVRYPMSTMITKRFISSERKCRVTRPRYQV